MKELKRVPLEAILVLAVGAGIGLAGNRLNGDGLVLCRDYFPKSPPRLPSVPAPVTGNTQTSVPKPEAAAPAPGADATAELTPAPGAPDSAIVQRLHQHGLQVVTDAETAAAYEDPGRLGGLIVFIDARNDERYAEGHIPGAYQFDHYRMERYLDQVLPAVFLAEKVIVYCGGGDCEDSEFAAIELLRQGADGSRLYVYPGGMAEWKQSGRPVEQGPRDSGFIVGGEQ